MLAARLRFIGARILAPRKLRGKPSSHGDTRLSFRGDAGPRVVVDDHARELAGLSLAQAQEQEQRNHHEPDDEAPPKADRAVARTEAEPQAHGHAEAPEADDVRDDRHLRVAESSEQADRHDLQAVEHLKHAGNRQQLNRERKTAASFV